MRCAFLFVFICLGNNIALGQWAKVFGGTNYDEGYQISQTYDSGYIVGGYTSPWGNGGKDFLVIKINKDGSMDSLCSWQDVVEETLFYSKYN